MERATALKDGGEDETGESYGASGTGVMTGAAVETTVPSLGGDSITTLGMKKTTAPGGGGGDGELGCSESAAAPSLGGAGPADSSKKAALDSTECSTEKKSNKSGSSNRPWCKRCDRALSVCLCSALPYSAISLKKCRVWVLQHPREATRKNASVPISQLCFDCSSFELCTGRSFRAIPPHWKHAMLQNRCLLLLPTDDSVELSVAVMQQTAAAMPPPVRSETKSVDRNHDEDDRIALLFIDGTWKEAKYLYQKDMARGLIPATVTPVKLSLSALQTDGFRERRFHIRNPPKEGFLSTAECIAWASSAVEEDPALYDTLMYPLDFMVQSWENAKQRKLARKQATSIEKQRDLIVSCEVTY